jgi:hypothetical protein
MQCRTSLPLASKPSRGLRFCCGQRPCLCRRLPNKRWPAAPLPAPGGSMVHCQIPSGKLQSHVMFVLVLLWVRDSKTFVRHRYRVVTWRRRQSAAPA